jgi:hypothetical protein
MQAFTLVSPIKIQINNKTIIEFGFGRICWIITAEVCVRTRRLRFVLEAISYENRIQQLFITKASVCVIWLSLPLREITQTLP